MPRGIFLLLAGLCFGLAAPPADAKVFVYRDVSGAIQFSNAPVVPKEEVRFRLASTAWPTTRWLATRLGPVGGPRRERFNGIIHAAAVRHRVDSNLIKAVIRVESDFQPHAVSPKGALGLMQLMPGTARMLKVRRAFDPNANVDGGVRHLRYLIGRYSGDLKLALAAYNAGEGAVDRYNGIPPYQETREYVRRVLRYRDVYVRGS